MFYERKKEKTGRGAAQPGGFPRKSARPESKKASASRRAGAEPTPSRRTSPPQNKAASVPRGKAHASSGAVRASGKPVRQSVKPVSRPCKRKHPFLKLLAFLLLFVFAAAGALYVLPVDALGPDTTCSDALPEGYTHILLIGLDVNSYGTSRSDTMIIASVGEDRVVLTSLMRDTGVYIPGKSSLHRLNAAYTYGGADLLLQTVNLNFDMNLTLYAVVDYESFPELIDALGGVDISSVSSNEVAQLNSNIYDAIRRRYQSGALTKEEAIELYYSEILSGSGDFHLDGTQALGYARIRKTDSDFGRTERQRKVIKAALTALKRGGPVSAVRFAVKGLGCIETNMTAVQMISLGEKALFTSSIELKRLPVNGTFTDDGGMFYDINYSKNHDAFVYYVYGS